MSQPIQPQTRTGRAVLFVTIMASSLAFLEGSALNVALDALQQDLNASASQLLWIVNLYTLLLAALIMVSGALGDRLGRKRVYGIGIALFALSSLICGAAPNADLLIAARALQGVGGALMIPGSLAIISAHFPPESRGRAIGLWSAITTVVSVAGPLIGGWLAGQGLWRWVFFITPPLAAPTLAALILWVPESRDESATGGIDWAGAALITAALGALTYGFTEGPGRGFSSPLILAALIGGVLLLGAFIWWQTRSPAPMAPLRVFRSKTFSGANLLTFFLYGGLYAVLLFLPLNLIQVQGYDPIEAALALLPISVGLILLSRFTGGLADRIGARPLLTAGPLTFAAGALWLGFAGLGEGTADYWTQFFPGVMLIGVGMGITVAPLTTAVMTALDAQMAGLASGINNAVSRTGGALATAALGAAMLAVFQGALLARVNGLGLPAEALAALMRDSASLGATAVPAGLGMAQAEAAGQAIRLAFVESFRVLSWLGAALAALSAGLAFVLVGREGE